MESNQYFIIDFDSTFTKVEAFDVLCDVAQNGSPNGKNVLSQIVDITNMAMSGQISFRTSLEQRIKLVKAKKEHIAKVVSILKEQVSKSFVRNKSFFEKYSKNVFIVSNGFKEIIEPVVAEYGISPSNIFANTFEFDASDSIIGFDKENPLSQDNGKVNLLKKLKFDGNIYVIGDGYNDYEIKKAGLANKFYAFTENITRNNIVEMADHIAPSFDEVLYLNDLPMSISYPKSRIKVLLLENVHSIAKDIFSEEGYQVEVYDGGLEEDELIEMIKDVSIVGIRSKTQITKRVLENANKLIAIGAFCIGTNQIDLSECTKRGIAVFNAPYSNTRSVVELALGEIIMLMRNIPSRYSEMHKGIWTKSASNSYEIRGKKLGIVGYGNIGSQLSVLAESVGMEVYYYDTVEKLALGNAKKTKSLNELLSISDVISLHVDGRKENTCLISYPEFELMKKGVVFLNLARGSVVDLAALRDNLKSKKIKGAAVDVFLDEPKNNQEEFISDLRGFDNLILTPHIGGSTIEAQENIASFVPDKIINYINSGDTYSCVNLPNVQLPTFSNAHRLLHIHKNVAGILANITKILASHGANILGQYLKTNEDVGYVIIDIDKEYDKELIRALRKIENTIKFRVLY